MRRLLTQLFLIAGALAPAIFVPPAVAQTAPGAGQVSIGLLEGPSNRADDPRAQQYIVDHVQPGTTITRRFQVANETSSALELQLYDAAAEVKDGSFVFGDGRAENELTSWTTVGPERVPVPAGEDATASVTIKVPGNAAGGERYAVIWAEPPGATAASGVTVVNRVGIRIYLSVGGGEEPPSRFSLPEFTATRDEDGRPGVDIKACNDGGRAVDAAGALELFDGPGGTSAGPFPSETGTTIAPGECAVVPVRLDPAIPAGPWRAVARLRSGTTTAEAEALISFPDAPSSAAEPVPAKPRTVTGTSGGRWALLIALLLLLLVILLLLWWLWRRRKKKKEEEEAAAAAAGSGSAS